MQVSANVWCAPQEKSLSGWRSSLRRVCANFNRVSLEMVQAFQAGGAERENLLQQWMKSSDVATVSTELCLSQLSQTPQPYFAHTFKGLLLFFLHFAGLPAPGQAG